MQRSILCRLQSLPYIGFAFDKRVIVSRFRKQLFPRLRSRHALSAGTLHYLGVRRAMAARRRREVA